MAQSKPVGIWVNVYVARAQSSNMEDKNRLQELDRDNLKASTLPNPKQLIVRLRTGKLGMINDGIFPFFGFPDVNFVHQTKQP